MPRHKKKVKAKLKVKMLWPIIILGIVLGLVWFVVGALQSHWDGKTRFTTASINQQQVKLKSFDPQTGRGVALTLPGDLEVETVGGRGSFLASSLDKAGSAEWGADSIASYLGVMVAGEFRHLPLWDQIRWWWWSFKINWRELDMDQAGLVDYDLTPDGVKVGHLSPQWEARVRELFSSLAVAQQELSVKIINTTNTSGLATKAARELESSGINVVEVSSISDTNSDQNPVDACILVSPKELERSLAIKLIQKNFGCTWQEGVETTLLLGKQYQKFVDGE